MICRITDGFSTDFADLSMLSTRPPNVSIISLNIDIFLSPVLPIDMTGAPQPSRLLSESTGFAIAAKIAIDLAANRKELGYGG